MYTKKNISLLTVNVTLLTLGFFIYVLNIGASIIIPFIVALLLSFIIVSLSTFFKGRWLPKIIAFIASLFTIGLVLYWIAQIINSNINEIIIWAPEYQQKLIRITTEIASVFNIDEKIIVSQFIEKINIPSLISLAAALITSIVKNAWMILFFTIFLLLESKSFGKKLAIITGWEKSAFFQVFEQIQWDIKSYFLIKTIVSLWVALLSMMIMMILGLDFFLFWTFLIFLFNFIPNVGSIIAVCFPVIFSLVQFESPSLTLVFLLLMVAAQLLTWNIIEPRLMGNRLNLSPLVILVSLIFWGTLWGPIGMLLSVPIMVIINIVLAHIEVTRPIAVLLSERGIVKFYGMKDSSSWKFSIKKMRKILKK